MATHRFHPTRYFNVIGTAEPCLRIADGDTLVTDTIDASGLDASEVAVAERPNPMTGPFFVEGAEPGDTLAVRIDRLTPSRATGWTFSPLALTVLEPAAIAARPPPQRVVWEIGGNTGTLRLREPPKGLEDFTPPIPAHDRLLRGRTGARPGVLHRNQRAERRQHGLSAVCAGDDRVVSGIGAGGAVLSGRRPRLPGRR